MKIYQVEVTKIEFLEANGVLALKTYSTLFSKRFEDKVDAFQYFSERVRGYVSKNTALRRYDIRILEVLQEGGLDVGVSCLVDTLKMYLDEIEKVTHLDEIEKF